MQTTAILVWAYGVLVAVGGVVGFVKVGSKASLISGVGVRIDPAGNVRRGGLELTS